MTEDRPRRILIHAGFHKTGTSTVQDFLKANRETLRPHFLYYGKADFRALGALARRYGQRPYPWRLARFRSGLRRFLRSLPDGHDIVLSRETFSGTMPGHRGLFGRVIRSTLPVSERLARVLADETARRFPGAEIILFYTTRDREAWLRSVHGHLLRSIRLTDDYPAFARRLADTPGPEAEAKLLAERLAPQRVETAHLEHFANAPGAAAQAILSLMEVPHAVRDQLRTVPRGNIGQPEALRAAFLTLNRQIGNKRRLKAKKLAVLEGREDV
jgi:hypothetical protein